MGRQALLPQLFRGDLEHLQRITGPADLIGKGRDKKGAEMVVHGHIAGQQGDVPAGGGNRRPFFFLGETITQFFRLLEDQAAGGGGYCSPAVEDLGDRVSGKTAGIGDILHGYSLEGHEY